MVIFGIKESNINFTRPLKFQDLVPLKEICKQKWNGEIIKDVLLDLENEIGKIKYAVGNYGCDLKKGLRLSNIPHVHDVTHKIALILEKLLTDNYVYSELTKRMTEMRCNFAQSDIAYILPPKQRKKSRYQNIKIVSDWCKKALNFIESDMEKLEKIINNLEWIVSYKSFIGDLSEISEAICGIGKVLKVNGLSNLSLNKCISILNNVNSKLGIKIKDQILEYLKATLEMLPESEKILITSDIIESAFGKYKNYVSSNPMAGITNLVLSIAAFTSSLTEDEVREAFEKIRKTDIKRWTDKFIGKTLIQKRREALKCA